VCFLRISSLPIRRLLTCLLLLLGLGLGAQVSPAHAQAAPTLESLDVALWPEFDQHAMLVIYRANLPATTTFPAAVSLPIPQGVQPNAVAQADASGRLVDVDYTLASEAGQAVVQMQVTNPLIQVEYYQTINVDGSARSYTFVWPGGLSIGTFTVEVQDPPAISNLTLQPPATDEVVGEYGLTYKRVDLGRIGPSDQPSLQVSYTKAGQGLTIDSLQATPSSQAQPAVASTPEPRQVVAWVVIGLVAIVAGVVAVLYLRLWRVPARPRAPHRRHRPRPESPKPAPSSGGKLQPPGRVFCHVCGQEAGPGDCYCRTCGTRLRGPS
jgi:hypothetical protein